MSELGVGREADRGHQLGEDVEVAERAVLAPDRSHLLAVEGGTFVLERQLQRRLAAVVRVARLGLRDIAAEDFLDMGLEVGGDLDRRPACEQAAVGGHPQPILVAPVFDDDGAGCRLAARGGDLDRHDERREGTEVLQVLADLDEAARGLAEAGVEEGAERDHRAASLRRGMRMTWPIRSLPCSATGSGVKRRSSGKRTSGLVSAMRRQARPSA